MPRTMNSDVSLRLLEPIFPRILLYTSEILKYFRRPYGEARGRNQAVSASAIRVGMGISMVGPTFTRTVGVLDGPPPKVADACT